MLTDEIWQTIDRFSIIFGFLISAPIFYSAWALYQERKKRRKNMKAIMADPGSRPTVLIVDVRKPDSTSIQPQVRKYLSGANFERVPFSDETIFVAEFKGEMESADMDVIMSAVRKGVGGCVDYGTDKIHLFLHCPLPVAASVGEYLSNFAAPVILHHNQLNKGYENWGPLHR